jgi:hypothetical protein
VQRSLNRSGLLMVCLPWNVPPPPPSPPHPYHSDTVYILRRRNPTMQDEESMLTNSLLVRHCRVIAKVTRRFLQSEYFGVRESRYLKIWSLKEWWTFGFPLGFGIKSGSRRVHKTRIILNNHDTHTSTWDDPTQ